MRSQEDEEEDNDHPPALTELFFDRIDWEGNPLQLTQEESSMYVNQVKEVTVQRLAATNPGFGEACAEADRAWSDLVATLRERRKRIDWNVERVRFVLELKHWRKRTKQKPVSERVRLMDVQKMAASFRPTSDDPVLESLRYKEELKQWKRRMLGHVPGVLM